MRAIFLILVVSWRITGFAAVPELTRAEVIIRELLGRGGSMNADLSHIASDERRQVIERLRETANKRQGYALLGNTVLDTTDADLLLLRLGDSYTMERMSREYEAYDSEIAWGYVQKTFERSRQPALIPYLAKDLYSEEDPEKDVIVKPRPESLEFAQGAPPKSIFSAVTVIRIIERSPEFRADVRNSASEMYDLRVKSPAEFRLVMREWWELNRAAITKGDYKAVTPIQVKPQASVEPAAPSNTSGNLHLPDAMIAESTPSAAEETVPQRNVAPVSWLLLIGGVACIVLLLARRRR